MTSSPDLDLTAANQRDASDPRASAWVVANAGAGKTFVLTQRVIRLLLAGVDPAAILCLTFTKVAAAEMSRRVFDKLGEWTRLADAALETEIAALEGRPATPAEMRRARQLFARALETPGGLKIQTIHAFCERLLHAFPLEANVPGQFTVMDEQAAAAALAAARDEVMGAAAAAPDAPLGRAARALAENTADMQIGEALDALIDKRDALHRWMENAAGGAMAGGIDDVLADLRDRLGLEPEESEETICRAICAALPWDHDRCRELVAALEAGDTKTDLGAATALAAVLAAGDPAAEARARIGFFLTAAGAPRDAKRRFGARTHRAFATLEADFAAEAERILALLERRRRVRTYAATTALLVVGDAILGAYQRAKRRAGALDFSDLITKTRNLLSRADAAQWVLFKLDRRVEHILVDEAQDTSPDQWMVVQAIAEEFFAGAGATQAPRTIFAVGDDKQSIFRFQGAVPAMLSEMRLFFDKKVSDAGGSFVTRPLYLSFRSTEEVLRAVDAVFGTLLSQEITSATYTAHAAHRLDAPGQVVLLPRVVRKSRAEPEDWTEPYTAPSAAETGLAERIAAEIKRLLGSVLPSGKRVAPGEILVLVRRRDAFAAAMNRALRKLHIPTAGADRIPVATHIAVLDLLALADVMLLAEDDLQLAACCKSPLLGLSEDDLMRLATSRGRNSLWQALQEAEEPPFVEIAETLRRWRGMADQVTPFRFFATLLGPEGGRRRFRARLGGEADDVLDTFLSQALAYEASEPPSLQGFVRFIRANERDIKRETEEGASGVRVMTVHGAKGLEADVVFLADTGGAAVVHQQRKLLVGIGEDRDDPAFFWRRRKDEAPDLQAEADRREDRETESEYLRLLYVAMTRARDVLYVAGVRLINVPPRSWYTLVADALLPPDVARDAEDELAEPYVWPQPPRSPLPPAESEREAPPPAPLIPAWLHERAPSPPPAPEPLRPSGALGEPDPPRANSEAARPNVEARLRGRLVHRLLETLPAVPAAERARFAERIAAPDGLAPDQLPPILAEAEAVLALVPLRRFFAPDARAEAEIVGRLAIGGKSYAVNGRIDRLARDAAGWHLLDFKTDRSVPADAAAIDPAQILQLALYRRLLSEMAPEAEITATLAYTAAAKVIPVPAALMEQALSRLAARANSVP